MYNWSHIDEEAMKRDNPEKYRRWRLVQMLNYDLEGNKLDRHEVMELWPDIKEDVDPYVRRFIEFLLWGTMYRLPEVRTSWNRKCICPQCHREIPQSGTWRSYMS